MSFVDLEGLIVQYCSPILGNNS